jgi:hypothetical protein
MLQVVLQLEVVGVSFDEQRLEATLGFREGELAASSGGGQVPAREREEEAPRGKRNQQADLSAIRHP